MKVIHTMLIPIKHAFERCQKERTETSVVLVLLSKTHLASSRC